MRGVLRVLWAGLCGGWMLAAGCMSPAKVEDNMPRLAEKLPRTKKVYLPYKETGAAPVSARDGAAPYRALKAALEELGVETATASAHGEKGGRMFAAALSNKCDVAIALTVRSWEYSDAGFSGTGHRDRVEMGAVVMDPAKERVISRATVTVGHAPWTGFGGVEPAETLKAAMEEYAGHVFE